jgi:hypothetical protein
MSTRFDVPMPVNIHTLVSVDNHLPDYTVITYSTTIRITRLLTLPASNIHTAVEGQTVLSHVRPQLFSRQYSRRKHSHAQAGLDCFILSSELVPGIAESV